MSVDDKKMSKHEDDGLAELMNAFGGYAPNAEDADSIAPIDEEVDDHTPDEFAIELPEIPLGMEDHGGSAVDAPAEEIVVPMMEEIVPADEDSVPVAEETELSVTEATKADDEKIQEPAPVNEGSKKKKKKKNKNKISPATSSEDAPIEKVPVAAAVAVSSDDSADGASDSEVKEENNHEKPASKKDEKKKTEKKDKKETKENKSVKDKADKKKSEKEEKPADDGEESANPASSLRLVTVLTVICAAVALLLASVNHFTGAKIAENTELTMLASIRDIFDETVEAEAVALPEGSGLTSAYLVVKNSGVCGYAASVDPTGFGGPLSLMVGVDSGGTVVGVEVVSMSETPGLGSRVGGEEFLSRFIGKSGEVTVDAISGATISSKAVMAGVNSVTTDLLDLEALASEKGMPVVAYDASQPSTDTTAPVTETPETEVVTEAVTEETVTVSPVTDAEPTPPDVSKGNSPVQNIVENPNKVNDDIRVDYLEETAEYETLTTEPESTEPEETAPDSAETSAK